MKTIRLILLASLPAISGLIPLSAADAPPAYMGRWEGRSITPGKTGELAEFCAEVVGVGGDKVRIQFMSEFFKRAHVLKEINASAAGGKIVFDNGGWKGEISSDSFKGEVAQGAKPPVPFSLSKSDFRSPSLDLKPPSGSTVLFDGKNLDAWKNVNDGGAPGWQVLGDGAFEVVPAKPGTASRGRGNIATKEQFGDIRLHIEFRLPYEPEALGQGRGNSGLFLQGVYEVQVLDSFGFDGLWNDCGAIYHIAPPKVNACLPPGEWQTYDILFRAARFSPDGSVSEYPRMTVRQNGILVQYNEELRQGTKVAGSHRPATTPPATGPIELQDHGHPVQYRNIWTTPLPDSAEALIKR